MREQICVKLPSAGSKMGGKNNTVVSMEQGSDEKKKTLLLHIRFKSTGFKIALTQLEQMEVVT